MAYPRTSHFESEGTNRRPHVLLAEDDARMRELLATVLRRAGFVVLQEINGAELLDDIVDFLIETGNEWPIDLIITDVCMPGIGGLEALAELRRHDWDIPVIVITAFGDEETHAEAGRLGAVAVFDKPFDLDELRAVARHHTGLREPI